MKEFKIGNYSFSDSTNRMLERAEEMLREEDPLYELSEVNALRIIDYMLSFIYKNDDALEEALEFLNLYS